jgi:hypothetical protein
MPGLQNSDDRTKGNYIRAVFSTFAGTQYMLCKWSIMSVPMKFLEGRVSSTGVLSVSQAPIIPYF